MNDYKFLAAKYLKLNKTRTISTIIGTALGVAVLFFIMNTLYTMLLAERNSIREESPYELVAISEDKSIYDEIAKDPRVTSAYRGGFSNADYLDVSMQYMDVITSDDALLFNIQNPYRLDSVRDDLMNMYNVQIEYNEALAATYIQGTNGGYTAIEICGCMLICFILVVFTVGIVRNSIQLTTLEQIRDYGNLRCIGASKGQLKAIIYFEGFLLESIGIVIGVIIGFIAYLITIAYMQNLPTTEVVYPIGFYIAPLLYILIAFYGDLWFAMMENCKIISNMSPVSALRGEFRIKKEKYKVLKYSIFGKIFGIEADYAYKNIRRNPARFRRSVWALGIGMGFLLGVYGMMTSAYGFYNEEFHLDAHYQTYYCSELLPWMTPDEAQSILPFEQMQKMSEFSNLEEIKKIYGCDLLIADDKEMKSHLNADFWNKTYSRVDEYLPVDETSIDSRDYPRALQQGVFDIKGIDEEDIDALKKQLVEGSLELSENGVILINETREFGNEDADDTVDFQVYGKHTDYKVGDTIEVFDPVILREKCLEKAREIMENYNSQMALLNIPEPSEEGYMYYAYNPNIDNSTQLELNRLDDEKTNSFNKMISQVRQEMRENGQTKKLVIEGIIKKDPRSIEDAISGYFALLTTQDNYFKLSGLDENSYIGVKYHFSMFPFEEYNKKIGFDEDMISSSQELVNASPISVWLSNSYYANFYEMIKMQIKYYIAALAFVVFIVGMVCINIVNTSVSSLYLRRRELAQLRVIGLSKDGLIKMVCMEGVIASIFANIIGLIIGFTSSKLLIVSIIGISIRIHHEYSWIGVLLTLILSTAVLVGSMYFPIKKMNNDMAADLKESGD